MIRVLCVKPGGGKALHPMASLMNPEEKWVTAFWLPNARRRVLVRCKARFLEEAELLATKEVRFRFPHDQPERLSVCLADMWDELNPE